MNQLMDLPDELLDEIVLCVSAASFEAVPSLGLTCRRLQRICRPVHWEHVILPWRLNKTAPIARFIERHAGNNSICSIRLRPQPAVLNAFKIGMKNAFGHVDALSDCLSTLSKLTAFSMFLVQQIDSRCSLPGSVLARIIRSLPPSLAHLELDTEGVDRIVNQPAVQGPEDHLCLAISKHMPHLETLHVRLSCICTDLFCSLSAGTAAQITSRLRRALIRLDTSPLKDQDLDIPADVGNCKMPRHDVRLPGRHATLDRIDFNTRISELQAAGAFPQLERFILFSWKHDFDRSGARSQIQDFATRSVTRFPKMETRISGWYQPELRENYSSDMFLVRNHDYEDLVGERRAIEASLLHEVSWQEREDGVRLPPVTRLASKELRLRTGNLVSLEYLRRLLEERARNEEAERERSEMGMETGTLGTARARSCLPDIACFANAGVVVTEM